MCGYSVVAVIIYLYDLIPRIYILIYVECLNVSAWFGQRWEAVAAVSKGVIE